MMKIFMLEPDTKLQDEIDICLNNCRLKIDVKKAKTEQELFDEERFLDDYSLFVLNLKNPTDTHTIDFIRNNGSLAPILLVLEADVAPHIFHTLSSFAYNDVIMKNFFVEEIVYRIYKLCNIWNETTFYLGNDISFNCQKKIFTFKGEEVLLGKKETLLLKCFFLKLPSIVTCDEIIAFVYENEIVSCERVRALIKQLRDKLPCDLIRTLNGKGYQLVH